MTTIIISLTVGLLAVLSLYYYFSVKRLKKESAALNKFAKSLIDSPAISEALLTRIKNLLFG